MIFLEVSSVRIGKVAILILLLCSMLLIPQEQTGDILGTVKMGDGAPLEGVTITARGDNLPGSKTVRSDARGRYRILNVPSGIYSLLYTFRGMRRIEQKKVILGVGRTIRIDTVMKFDPSLEELEANITSATIDMKKSIVSDNIRKEKIKCFAGSMNFLNILKLSGNITSAVNYDEEDVRFIVDGASSADNSFFVDGMEVTSIDNGIAGQSIDYDSIEEIQVKYSGQPAEFRGAMGGVISIITKRGAKRFYGNFRLRYENLKLRDNPGDALVCYLGGTNWFYKPVEKDRGYRGELGLSLGGYIIKDRLWFYTSVNRGRSETIRRGYYKYNPDKLTIDSRSISDKLNLGFKLTAVLSDKLYFTGSINYNRQDIGGELPEVDGTSNVKVFNGDSKRNYYKPEITLAGQLRYSAGDNFFFTLSGGYFRANSYQDNFTSSLSTLAFINEDYILPQEKRRGIFWRSNPRELLQATIRNIKRRMSLKGDLSAYFNYAGEHVLKGGFFFSRNLYDSYRGAWGEEWSFYWKNGNNFSKFALDDGQIKYLDYGYVKVECMGIKGKSEARIGGFYLQDSWTIGERLTLNFGVRMEAEMIPLFSLDMKASKALDFNITDKISPRIGFVYNLGKGGKAKIFGSTGIYYDVMKMSAAAAMLGASKKQTAYYNINTPDWEAYENADSIIFSGSDAPVLGGELLKYYDGQLNNRGEVQPDIKPYSKLEFSLGYQQVLFKDYKLTLRVLHNRILNAVENVGTYSEDHSAPYICNPGSDWINNIYNRDALQGKIPLGISCIKAKREFSLLQLSIEKSLSGNWFGGMTISLSKLWGNYSGLGSYDIDKNSVPGMQDDFDTWFLQYDSHMKPIHGRLPDDRPFRLKCYGAYSFNSGLSIGFTANMSSGTPISRRVNLMGYSSFLPNGRMSDGRTPLFWQIDLFIEYNVKISRRVRANMSLNIVNLTNNRISIRKFDKYFEEYIFMNNSDLLKGFDIDTYMNDLGSEREPGFMKNAHYQLPIQIVFGAKLTF